MTELYNDILNALKKEDKEAATKRALQALENEEIEIVDLYQKVLTPALAHVVKEYPLDDDLIWREHVRSGIIRTIIELAYPYVLEQRKAVDGPREKVMVMCPEFEDHELGAKMVSDFFKLEGFASTFIGARTPINTVLKAIEIVQPKYLVISVTNFFNIVSVKRTIETIREKTDPNLKILLGGRAITANPATVEELGADIHLNGYEDIKRLGEKETHA